MNNENMLKEFHTLMLEIRERFVKSKKIRDKLKKSYCYQIGQICYLKEHRGTIYFEQQKDEKGRIVGQKPGIIKGGKVIIVEVSIEDGESWLDDSEDEICMPQICYTVLRIFDTEEKLFNYDSLIYSKTWATYSDVLLNYIGHELLDPIISDATSGDNP